MASLAIGDLEGTGLLIYEVGVSKGCARVWNRVGVVSPLEL